MALAARKREKRVQGMKKQHYTYTDYLNWDTEDRYELIDGVPYMMGAPTVRHQDIVGNIYFELRSHLNDKPCRVYLAPIDVRLNADDLDDTVVQPDVIVVCDEDIIEEKSIKGAPGIVIEVLSPSSVQRDMTLKLEKYLEAGVKEYWVIDPDENRVLKFTPVKGKDAKDAMVRLYFENDNIESDLLPELKIDLKSIFTE
jgi:Uma2 family endonuclease